VVLKTYVHAVGNLADVNKLRHLNFSNGNRGIAEMLNFYRETTRAIELWASSELPVVLNGGRAFPMSRVPEKQGDTVSFYPRDAMLARVTATALCLCPSVCLSVCHKSVFHQNG